MFRDLSPEARVPQDHPLWAIQGLVEAARKELSPPFDVWCARMGRPSMAPAPLLRAAVALCTWNGTQRKCGCSDASCTQNY